MPFFPHNSSHHQQLPVDAAVDAFAAQSTAFAYKIQEIRLKISYPSRFETGCETRARY